VPNTPVRHGRRIMSPARQQQMAVQLTWPDASRRVAPAPILARIRHDQPAHPHREGESIPLLL
jgi:hypothetical protein